ncbi:hypothetical protein BC834DRAFT_848238 [Gloeopeniophorella convolvens]|nr:hypothetical protein BC834DRAFT_848238 [Gloeopeniophorella convolvens]
MASDQLALAPTTRSPKPRISFSGWRSAWKHTPPFPPSAEQRGHHQKDQSFKREKHLARWGESIDSLTIDLSSQLTLRLFAERDDHGVVLVGELELPYTELEHSFAPRDFHLTPVNLSTKQPQHVTLRLAITIEHAELHSEPAFSSNSSKPSPISRMVEDSPIRGPSSTPSADETGPGRASIAEMLYRVDLPIVDRAAGKLGGPSAPVASMANLAEQSPSALDQAASVYDTWSVVLTRMKWVVDCTEKVAEIHPYVKIAWSVLSLIPRTILAQVERDENVKALVLAMSDALDLARDASAFENNIRDSAQREILMDMLTHACTCSKFIQKYAENTQFSVILRDAVAEEYGTWG